MGRRPAAVDAVLYGASLAFALLVAGFASIPIYREWGRIAAAPYAVGAVASVVAALRRGPRGARIVVAVAVLAGSAILPLALEVAWRARTAPGLHAQSEAIITEEAGDALADGRDPYATTYVHGPLEARPVGTKTHFPYLPAMLLYGVPRAVDGHSAAADARLAFAAATFGVAALALIAWQAPAAAKLRAVQFLAVLPTGALLAATGGDDLPVLALLLLALVLARQRRPVASGLAIGLAGATKQTAWILLPFLVATVLARHGRRSAAALAAAAAAVAIPIIAVFVAWNPGAFWEDAVLFPVGLGRQPTPAATTTPGSILVDALPGGNVVVTLILAVTIVAVAAYLLVGRPPQSASGAAIRAAIVLSAAFVLAPAARLGYLVYPADLLAWGVLLGSGSPGLRQASPRGPGSGHDGPRRPPGRRRSSR